VFSFFKHALVLLLFNACSNVPGREPVANMADSLSADPVKQLQQLETRSASRQEVPLGTLLGSIEFSVSVKPSAETEETSIPWISLDAGPAELANLEAANDIVIPYQHIELIIDYPLSFPAHISLSAEKGFSRLRLFKEITAAYNRIYAEEESSATTKTIPVDKRKTIANRNRTDGRYGIWGHDVSDLVLSSADVYREAGGKIIVTLVVES